MSRTKILTEMVVAASILSFASFVEAAPVAASTNLESISKSGGPIVQVLTRAGVAHHSTRRTAGHAAFSPSYRYRVVGDASH